MWCQHSLPFWSVAHGLVTLNELQLQYMGKKILHFPVKMAASDREIRNTLVLLDHSHVELATSH